MKKAFSGVMGGIKGADRSDAANESRRMRTEKYSLNLPRWRSLVTLIRAVLVKQEVGENVTVEDST